MAVTGELLSVDSWHEADECKRKPRLLPFIGGQKETQKETANGK